MECLQQDTWTEEEQVRDPQQETRQEESSASAPEQRVSITQAAKLHNVTRQAIYVAIKRRS